MTESEKIALLAAIHMLNSNLKQDENTLQITCPHCLKACSTFAALEHTLKQLQEAANDDETSHKY